MNSRKWVRGIALAALLGAAAAFPAGLRASSSMPGRLSARAAILVSADTGRILFELNADTPLPPASLTKMMTEYLVLRAIDAGSLTWDTVTTVNARAQDVGRIKGNANVGLVAGQKRTVEELFAAMAMRSGNDAAIALAELAAGSEKAFVDWMNAEAACMGLASTTFLNCSGLPNRDMGPHFVAGSVDEQNAASARDAAMLAWHLITDFPDALEYSSATSKKVGAFTAPLLNIILMLPGHPQGKAAYDGLDGVKTGFTQAAGYCFAASAVRNGQRLISVVMGCPSIESRDADTRLLLDYGFNNHRLLEAARRLEPVAGLEEVPVDGGERRTVRVVAANSLPVTVCTGEKDLFHFSYEPIGPSCGHAIPAPVGLDQVVGIARLVYDKEPPQFLMPKRCPFPTAVPLIAIESVARDPLWTGRPTDAIHPRRRLRQAAPCILGAGRTCSRVDDKRFFSEEEGFSRDMLYLLTMSSYSSLL